MSGKLHDWYISLISSPVHRGFDLVFFTFLRAASAIFSVIVFLRNFFYDKKILRTANFAKPLISVGNISWGGSGKSSLTIKIASLLKDKNVALLRRGYGVDEEKLLKNSGRDVFSGKDRVRLMREQLDRFDCFILDDGFQYRRLGRTCDIVVMAAREFSLRDILIPASIFREPRSSLKRADAIVVNHSSELPSRTAVMNDIRRYTDVPVFFADYLPRAITDQNGNKYEAQALNRSNVYALTAIGYPRGFFAKLRQAGIAVKGEIAYPDHHELTPVDIDQLLQRFKRDNVTHIIVTAKDKNRFGLIASQVTILVLEVDMVIEQQEELMSFIRKKNAL